MKKDITKFQEEISQQAMSILEPLYNVKEFNTTIDKETGEVFLGYEYKHDPVREKVISSMVALATDDFLKNKGLYSSSIYHVCADFDGGIETGIVPSLAKDEDVVAFFDANQKNIIRKAERLCSFYGANFEDIPGYDYADRHMKSSTNKIAVTRYVVNEEINEISSSLHKFRNYLEEISYPKELDKGTKKISLRKRDIKESVHENENSQIR